MHRGVAAVVGTALIAWPVAGGAGSLPLLREAAAVRDRIAEQSKWIRLVGRAEVEPIARVEENDVAGDDRTVDRRRIGDPQDRLDTQLRAARRGTAREFARPGRRS